MNYSETIQYLYSQLPLFTRDGASAYKANLTNTIALCSRLHNPQNNFKSVHIGGTNGKGSTSHILAAILQTAGYKTGLYTSPHLKDFRERIRINGQIIPEQDVVDFVEDHKADFDEIKPSFFEMTVALAFDIFAREKVDIAVVEVGLGGRLDSTNIITPLLSIITNIGWDHTNILGESLNLIAAEKAGIIKPGVPVIIGEYQPEVAAIFIEKAKLENSAISFASDDFVYEPESLEAPKSGRNAQDEKSDFLHLKICPAPKIMGCGRWTMDLNLDLTGAYQRKNLKTVISAVAALRSQGFSIGDEHVKTAVKQVITLTGLHGRWEILNKNPLTICDTGHNPEGMREVLKNIASLKFNKLHFVIGMMNDKDISKILALLPANEIYYFCKPGIPRGLDPEILKIKAESFGLRGEVYPSVKAAFFSAQSHAAENDLVFVGGSTFVVAEVV